MKNYKLFFNSLLIFLKVFPFIGNAQNWVQNDGIYNTSGVPSLTFSAPRFTDLDNGGDVDLILRGNNAQPIILKNL